jgi:hypothetical protein
MHGACEVTAFSASSGVSSWYKKLYGTESELPSWASLFTILQRGCCFLIIENSQLLQTPEMRFHQASKHVPKKTPGAAAAAAAAAIVWAL